MPRSACRGIACFPLPSPRPLQLWTLTTMLRPRCSFYTPLTGKTGGCVMYLCFNAREHAERVIAVHGMLEQVVGLNTEESLCRSVLASSITRAGAW